MAKKVRIGIDFDGVLAYNPFRIIRAPVKWFKKRFLGVNKLKFFVPKNELQRWIWSLMHESSILPGVGCELLKELNKDNTYEFFLVTARYGFLKGNMMHWLDKKGLTSVFKIISVNEATEQPHEYKLRKITELKLDYFIEDNFDIVSHVSKNSNTKVLWVYNIVDRNQEYKYKFPNLKRALEFIESQ